jgi:hypothetical protein
MGVSMGMFGVSIREKNNEGISRANTRLEEAKMREYREKGDNKERGKAIKRSRDCRRVEHRDARGG